MITQLSDKTNILVQGITGKQGQRETVCMLRSGTHIVAGVTPGKGGGKVSGVPVYNSVKEAIQIHSDIGVSILFVPPQFVKDAALEAIEAGIKLLIIITENMPTHDFALIYDKASEKGARIIGPASVGLIRPGMYKLGAIGGDGSFEIV